jgi:pimeloyl-ACP methyl ester carboxylesterase
VRRRWTVVGREVIHSRETPGTDRLGARPLVFVPGVGTTNRYARPLLTALEARGVPTAAIELPGLGSSSSVDVPGDVAGQADVVAGWLRTTRRWPTVLVGNSMGAQTVIEVAVRHPGLVDGAVLIGPTIDADARSLGRQAGKLLLDATLERPASCRSSPATRCSPNGGRSCATSARPSATGPRSASVASTCRSPWCVASTTSSPRGGGSHAWPPPRRPDAGSRSPGERTPVTTAARRRWPTS